MKLSSATFIKDTIEGAYCLFESLASTLFLVDEALVIDLGSTDGTFEVLTDIAAANDKVVVYRGEFPRQDAGAFADLANDCISLASHDVVWFYQADEIPHQDLLTMIRANLAEGLDDLALWRIQYRDNFQTIKWFPHLVHRIGRKDGTFNFVGDGMTSDRTFDAKIVGPYDGGWFPKWGQLGQDGVAPHVNAMLMDVSLVGGFRDNIPERRAMHAPFWHEEPSIEGVPAFQWIARERANDDWTKPTSPFNIPKVMRGLVGKTRYEVRSELIEAIKRDDVRQILGVTP